MIQVLKGLDLSDHLGTPICCRVGIWKGELLAGVMKTKNFSFDLFGAGVKMAELHQTRGEPSRVCISQSTYEAIHHLYETETLPCRDFGGKLERSYLIRHKK